MKVTLLKDFGGEKKGATVEATKERAAYWELVGVAKKATSKTTEKVEAPKKEAAKKAPVKAAPKKAKDITTSSVKKAKK